MKVKKYVADSMPEAMNTIRKELGADAVILNSKEIKSGGIFGLFQKKKIEVIAAADKEPREIKREAAPPENMPDLKEREKDSDVLKEIKYLKQLLESQSFHSDHHFPPQYEHVYSYLIEQGAKVSFAKGLIEKILEEHRDEEPGLREMKEKVKSELARQFARMHSPGIPFENQIIQFVGPTGVGKTTTLAKVAAHSMLEKKKKIAFITADTYRIAAIEQLKTYARILDVPLEVAYTISDYKAALEKFKDYDLIFVDTAGRNFRDATYVNELEQLIQFDSYGIETYLVLSLTAKPTDVEQTFQQFQQIPIEKVIFTKMDETDSYGSLINIGIGEEMPIAYITNGQDVPDDIIIPDEQFISSLIMRRYAHE